MFVLLAALGGTPAHALSFDSSCNAFPSEVAAMRRGHARGVQGMRHATNGMALADIGDRISLADHLVSDAQGPDIFGYNLDFQNWNDYVDRITGNVVVRCGTKDTISACGDPALRGRTVAAPNLMICMDNVHTQFAPSPNELAAVFTHRIFHEAHHMAAGLEGGHPGDNIFGLHGGTNLFSPDSMTTSLGLGVENFILTPELAPSVAYSIIERVNATSSHPDDQGALSTGWTARVGVRVHNTNPDSLAPGDFTPARGVDLNPDTVACISTWEGVRRCADVPEVAPGGYAFVEIRVPFDPMVYDDALPLYVQSDLHDLVRDDEADNVLVHDADLEADLELDAEVVYMGGVQWIGGQSVRVVDYLVTATNHGPNPSKATRLTYTHDEFGSLAEGSWSVGALEVGDSWSRTVRTYQRYTWWSGLNTSDTHSFDVGLELPDPYLADNLFDGTGTERTADLRVEVTSVVNDGSQVTVSYRVRNGGVLPVNRVTRARITAKLLGTVYADIPTLQPGQETSVLTAVLPNTSNRSGMEASVTVDYDGWIFEWNEENNRDARTVYAHRSFSFSR